MARRGWDDEADRRLVERAVAGHEQAFEVLLRRHHDRIYGIALRTTGDATAAEDIAQDVAIQLWRVLATFTGASLFGTWLYRIVVNRCLTHRRTRRVTGRDTRPLLDADVPSTPGPEQQVVDSAAFDAATVALASLPPEQRAAVVLCRVQGLSYREAATVADVSEAALRSRLERGRRNLLAAMQEWA